MVYSMFWGGVVCMGCLVFYQFHFNNCCITSILEVVGMYFMSIKICTEQVFLSVPRGLCI